MVRDMYRYELHAHTGEVSTCAHASSRQLVDAYVELGYAGVVITDHFNNYILESYRGSARDRVRRYLEGYYNAREYARQYDFTVLLGAETCLLPGPEDFLIYGIDEEFLYRYSSMYTMKQEELFNACRAYTADINGKETPIVFLQAHPCRSYCKPRDHRFLDGVEVYNANPRHNNNNHKALEFAGINPDYILTAGSDYHEVGDEGYGGIETEIKIADNADLVKVLKSGNYKLIKN